jgi:hypothetical protein
VFFGQYLKAAELFSRLCAEAPFNFKSNNAPQKVDVLGRPLRLSLSKKKKRTLVNVRLLEPCFTEP